VPEYLDFTFFQPKGRLANIVQGVWSASVVPHSPNSIKRLLQSDACSGILFNLNSPIQLNDKSISMGGVLLPVSKQAQEIILPPDSAVVGVRFHPAISFAILGRIYQQATMINQDEDNVLALKSLGKQLKQVQGHYARIVVLYRWLHKVLLSIDEVPVSLKTALQALERKKSPGELSSHVALSQRQIERQFQKWLDMTPKYYQRISRVKTALNALKYQPEIALANLALSSGFTDQAHMTREFQYIGKITPKQYSKRVIHDRNNI